MWKRIPDIHPDKEHLRFLSLDQGTSAMGYTIVEDGFVTKSDSVTFKGKTIHERVPKLRAFLRELLDEVKPDYITYEGGTTTGANRFGASSRRATTISEFTVQEVALAFGYRMDSTAKRKPTLVEVHSATIRSQVIDKADIKRQVRLGIRPLKPNVKDDVKHGITKLLGLKPKDIKDEDQTDSLAQAYTFAVQPWKTK